MKHHVQVGDYSRVRDSGPLKKDEEGDVDGGVDEDDHRGDGSLRGTPTPPRDRWGESLPLRIPPSRPLPRWGEVLPYGPWPPWPPEGREPLRDWNSLFISLLFSLLFS